MHKRMILLSFLFAAACRSQATVNSDDVNEDTFYGRYTVRYNADTATLDSFSQFTVGGSSGTTVRLTSPSKVTADGTEMKVIDGDQSAINIIGTFYTLDKAAITTPPASVTFVWTKNDGTTTYTNTVSIPSAVVPVASSFSRKQGLTVTYTGTDLASTESILCRLESKSTLTSSTKKYASASYSNTTKSCVFSATDLAEFELGTAKVTLSRTLLISSNPQGHPQGGYTAGYYYSKPVEITVNN